MTGLPRITRLDDAKLIYGPRPKSARPKSARPKSRNVSKRRTILRKGDELTVINVDDEPGSTIEDVVLILPISQPKQSIRYMNVGETLTTLKMVPLWFMQEDQEAPLKGIVYPSGITERRPFDSIARYRSVINQTNNFKNKAIRVGVNATETLVIALDKFAQQFGGDLSFTNKEVSFSQSAHRTACGIANLGSAHLLATDYISTAKFLFKTKLNYKKDLAKSDETMENFILSFASAIAEILYCENDYIRILSVEKNDNDEGNAEVNFGLTTPDQMQTQLLANDLLARARTGFIDNNVLKHVKSGKYQCKWMPFLTYLQLRPRDFATQHNFDYNRRGLVAVNRRGGYPYYIPLGWYRHALDISKKYPGDDTWLGYENIPGEWPVAFHGTHAEAVSNIAKDGLLIDEVKHDIMRDEAVENMGSKVDLPGLYLETRCKGGAHPWYTKTFSVYVSEKKTERFRVVFQCRVKPGEFTIHKSPITTGETWRVVDPNAIRPYGILVRKRKARKREGDESESDDEQ